MNSKLKNNRLINSILSILLASLLGITWYLNYSGFCFSQWRYLSDKDLIHAAILDSAYDINIEQSEEAAKKYFSEHPTCCSVDRTSHMTSSWIRRSLGGYYVEVELNYETRPDWIERKAAEPLKFYTQYVDITACGKVLRRYGESTKTLKKAVN